MCSAAILEWVNVFLLSSSSSNINKRNIDSNTYEEHELTVSTLLFVLESHQLISPSTYDTKGKEKDVKYLRSQLETIFETSFAEEEYITIQEMLPLILSACVTRSSEKEKCVGQIMALSESSQASLMEVIQDVMEKFPLQQQHDEDDYEDDGNGAHNHSIFSSNGSSFIGDTDDDQNTDSNINSASNLRRLSLLSISTPKSQHGDFGSAPCTPESKVKVRRYKRENMALLEENNALKLHVENLENQLQNVTSRTDGLISEKEQIQIAWEMKMVAMETEMKQKYNSDMLSKSKQIQKLDKTIATQNEALKELSNVRDELECTKSIANKVTKAEANLLKYKKKIDALNDERKKMKSLEERVVQLLERVTKAENKCKEIPTLESTLLEYKNDLNESELQNSEFCENIKLLKEEILELKRENKCIKEVNNKNDGVSCQQSKTEEEEEHIVVIQDNTLDNKSGISEFNPKLLEKIQKLEFENSKLKESINHFDTKKCLSLERNLENTERLKSSFEERYHNVKKELSDTKKISQETVAKLQIEIDQLQSKNTTLNESIETVTAENLKIKENNNRAIIEAKTNHENLLKTTMEEMQCHFDNKASEAKKYIDTLQTTVNESKQRIKKLEKYVKLGKLSLKKRDEKIKTGNAMLQKGKKALDRAKLKIDEALTTRTAAEQKVKTLKAENKLLLQKASSLNTENMKILENELERVLTENNNMQETILKLRKEKGKFKLSDFKDNTGHGYELISTKMLENENAKLKQELQALSNLKATNMLKSIRDSHNLERKVSDLVKERKELKNKNIHLKLKLERLMNNKVEVRGVSPNSSVSPSDNSADNNASPVPVSPVRLKRGTASRITKANKENTKLSSKLSSRRGPSRILTSSTLQLSSSKRSNRIQKNIEDLSKRNAMDAKHENIKQTATSCREELNGEIEQEGSGEECTTQ